MWSGGLVDEEGLRYCFCDVNLTSSALDGSMEGSQVLFFAGVTRFLQGAVFWLVGTPTPPAPILFLDPVNDLFGCQLFKLCTAVEVVCCLVTLGTVGFGSVWALLSRVSGVRRWGHRWCFVCDEYCCCRSIPLLKVFILLISRRVVTLLDSSSLTDNSPRSGLRLQPVCKVE